MPTAPVQTQQSLLKEILHAPIPGSIAFAFILFMGGALVSMTLPLRSELEIAAAISSEPIFHSKHRTPQVLGTTSTQGMRVAFTANGQAPRVTVNPGTAVRLAWDSSNATSCSVEPLGLTGLHGEGLTSPLAETTVFSIICEGGGGALTHSVTVEVAEVPTLLRE